MSRIVLLAALLAAVAACAGGCVSRYESPRGAAEADTRAFLDAITAGDTAAVKRYLDSGKVDANSRKGESPLLAALGAQHPDIAMLLIENGADLSGGEAEAALQIAAQNGYGAVIEKLLSRGTRIDAKGAEGRTALHSAVSSGNMEEVKLLLLRGGADPNARDDRGATPLHLAVARGDRQLVELLVDRGADVNATDVNGHTPLYDALNASAKPIAQFLVDNGARVEPAKASPVEQRTK